MPRCSAKRYQYLHVCCLLRKLYICVMLEMICKHLSLFLSVWQNLGFGEIRSRLQPGGLSSAVHSQEVCNPPGDQQPHFDRDRPQRLHRGNQSSEEATNGWGMKCKVCRLKLGKKQTLCRTFLGSLGTLLLGEWSTIKHTFNRARLNKDIMRNGSDGGQHIDHPGSSASRQSFWHLSYLNLGMTS